MVIKILLTLLITKLKTPQLIAVAFLVFKYPEIYLSVDLRFDFLPEFDFD